VTDTTAPQRLARASKCATSGSTEGFSNTGYSSGCRGSSLSERVHTVASFCASSTSRGIKSARSHRPLSTSSIQTDFDLSAKPSKKAAKKSVSATDAFRPHSSCPNEALAQYLDLINDSFFKWLDLPEPTLDQEEGRRLLEMVSCLPGCPLVPERYRRRSIFILLVDCAEKKCLVCGVKKGTLERAISCVRTHLNHRPFLCRGRSIGCRTCGEKSR
jgi:hypothetical protein